MTGTPAGWRDWAPDAGLGTAVLLLGLLEAANTDYVISSRSALALVAVGMAVAAGLCRRAPGAALALVWGVCAVQLVAGIDLMATQLAIGVVAFGCARWGSIATVWLSAVSMPLAALLAVVYVGLEGLNGLVQNAGFEQLVQEAYSRGDPWQVGAALVATVLLGAPWLAGLALRFLARARTSRVSQVAAEEVAERATREREQAEEIARLRDEQTRLARDVHDVVGHSLAVILAQAESAQYLPDVDTTALKETMATIATSARSSLQDVRQVLTTTQAPSPRPGGLDDLVEGVRGSGHVVASSVVGTPRPLPPELETVAFRVLQEMLTNAIRHGRRDVPVQVERHWDGELRIEVRNGISPAPVDDLELTRPVTVVPTVGLPVGLPGGPPAAKPPASAPGQGLEGMRRRLEAVGGRLDVRRREEPGGGTFTVTAWVPTRALTRGPAR